MFAATYNTDFSQTFYAADPDTERFEGSWVDCLCLTHKDVVTGEKIWRNCRRLPNNRFKSTGIRQPTKMQMQAV